MLYLVQPQFCEINTGKNIMEEELKGGCIYDVTGKLLSDNSLDVSMCQEISCYLHYLPSMRMFEGPYKGTLTKVVSSTSSNLPVIELKSFFCIEDGVRKDFKTVFVAESWLDHGKVSISGFVYGKEDLVDGSYIVATVDSIVERHGKYLINIDGQNYILTYGHG